MIYLLGITNYFKIGWKNKVKYYINIKKDIQSSLEFTSMKCETMND